MFWFAVTYFFPYYFTPDCRLITKKEIFNFPGLVPRGYPVITSTCPCNPLKIQQDVPPVIQPHQACSLLCLWGTVYVEVCELIAIFIGCLGIWKRRNLCNNRVFFFRHSLATSMTNRFQNVHRFVYFMHFGCWDTQVFDNYQRCTVPLSSCMNLRRSS